ncbi:MAG TPA: 4-alpha-glucanotransferase [Clostridiales bacterium]|nr:4-alpha-glucanotransferase [Clostridiales bacterium]
MRASGILLPIASLPSNYGIGAFSKEAYEFIDQLKLAGQKYWQILPIGPTSYGDSPYQSFSTFAGNPYFIDPEQLIAEGLLEEEEMKEYDFGDDPRYIDYEKIYLSRFRMLRRAYDRSNLEEDEKYIAFQQENAFWLEDYALYMAVKNSFGGLSWSEWDEDIKLRRPEAVAKYGKELAEDIRFYKYIQYLFTGQWSRLKKYANDKGIKIIGDLPIYVAFDSADTWSKPELFQLDGEQNPVAVAGCPPDAFSSTGQLWGNPLYRWELHRETGYEWWLSRIAYCFKLYDVVRIDHFKGFDEYYSIPYGDATAEKGHWEKGPGISLFHAIDQKLGQLDIIAEDLGYITESVRQLLGETGYPGMKVLEFAFDSREDSDYLPHNYGKNCVVYTGTHDNDTIHGWFDTINEEDKRMALNYMGAGSLQGGFGSSKTSLDQSKTDLGTSEKEQIHWSLIRLAQMSVAKLCVIPVQDYLGLGSEARINIPATVGNNWKWRLQKAEISKELLEKIKYMTRLYGR